MKKNNQNSSKYKKSAITGFITAVLLLIAINIISSYLFFRIDLTADKRHSLSPASIEMLKELEDKVYVKVYLKGDDFPADYKLFAKKVQEFLQELRGYSNQIHVEFIDPVAGKNREEINSIYGELAQRGLTPIPISKETSTGISTQYVIPGALIRYKEREFPANLVVSDPSGNEYWMTYSSQELEYNVMSAIRSLMKKTKPKVAFIEGHGELDFLNTSWVTYQLQRFYQVDRTSIDGRINSLRDIAVVDTVNLDIKIKGNKYDVLVIAQPTEPFSDFDKFIIDQHLMRGGKILWLIDGTTASMDSLNTRGEFFATARNLRLNDIFFRYGVRMNTNLLQDISCQSIKMVTGMAGDQPQFSLMAFPYALRIVNFSTHPIVRNMKKIKSEFAGNIDFVGNPELSKTVLMTSSDQTKLVPVPSIVTLNVARAKPNMQEFALRKLNIAVLVEGEFESAFSGIVPIALDTMKGIDFIQKSPNTRQIFISDGDIIRNTIDYKRNMPLPAGFDMHTNELYDNSQLIINCINFLCADDDLLKIRAKNFKIGPLDKLKVMEYSHTLGIVNIAAPLAIILMMAIIMLVVRRIRFKK
ncbi:gliding motility-associated ABC transporter substrate-binding protein GldG [Bacteroidales bacterium OttesenSCG-928-C03]|nr:gliding motility-associated ABC transporter substrate-binding protein GldG [Bacteroidales bacterium OttesenSCG-928-E04]MDL2309157.1 gliding motility-associated ABC transporter substrate-binding protein GldG [Bacteroidales bacterium OttesenSCG-928-C03]MDL2326945.1 gliding motility-associated ABC transporter substrate-binding protein GldG [Bacteroidales bacterium OttesenSCG-928-A14]